MTNLNKRTLESLDTPSRIRAEEGAFTLFSLCDRPNLESHVIRDDWYNIMGGKDMDNVVIVQMTEANANRYSYNPKALSKKVYGTPDLYFVLMYLNNYRHPGEMNLTLTRSIKILTEKGIKAINNAISVRGYDTYVDDLKKAKSEEILKTSKVV